MYRISYELAEGCRKEIFCTEAYLEANMALAKGESRDGSCTVLPAETVLPLTTEQRMTELEEALSLLLEGVTE